MKLVKNYLYNLANQIITLIIPLVTIPYISRVLGPGGVGINAYTNSIISYFILFGSIGIGLYGNRTIATLRDNPIKKSKAFLEIAILKIVMIVLAYCCFYLFLSFYDDFHAFLLIQSIALISAAFDISWFFMGIEDFKKTVVRNIAVKLIALIGIFTLVKTQDDVGIYILILTLSQLIGNLSLWGYLKKNIVFIPFKRLHIFKHFLPSIHYFIPQIAMQIYLVLNRTMLGSLTSIEAVAYYDNSDKIIKMLLAIVTATGTVMLPRIANHFAKGDQAQIELYLKNSFHFVCFLTFPLSLGIMSVSDNFCDLFFGPEFNGINQIMFWLCPVVICIAFSNVFGVQYLLPTNKVKAFTLSVTVGAIINFILNWYFIVYHGALGAVISTVISEVCVTLTQLYFLKKTVNLRFLFNGAWKYLLASAIMFVAVYLLGLYYHGLFGLIMQIALGLFVYSCLIFIFNPFFIQEAKKFIFKNNVK